MPKETREILATQREVQKRSQFSAKTDESALPLSGPVMTWSEQDVSFPQCRKGYAGREEHSHTHKTCPTCDTAACVFLGIHNEQKTYGIASLERNGFLSPAIVLSSPVFRGRRTMALVVSPVHTTTPLTSLPCSQTRTPKGTIR